MLLAEKKLRCDAEARIRDMSLPEPRALGARALSCPSCPRGLCLHLVCAALRFAAEERSEMLREQLAKASAQVHTLPTHPHPTQPLSLPTVWCI